MSRKVWEELEDHLAKEPFPRRLRQLACRLVTDRAMLDFQRAKNNKPRLSAGRQVLQAVEVGEKVDMNSELAELKDRLDKLEKLIERGGGRIAEVVR